MIVDSAACAILLSMDNKIDKACKFVVYAQQKLHADDMARGDFMVKLVGGLYGFSCRYCTKELGFES